SEPASYAPATRPSIARAPRVAAVVDEADALALGLDLHQFRRGVRGRVEVADETAERAARRVDLVLERPAGEVPELLDVRAVPLAFHEVDPLGPDLRGVRLGARLFRPGLGRDDVAEPHQDFRD